MKINFPALFQTRLSSYQFFLIYGNDPTVIERSLAFLKRTLGGELSPRVEADFLKNPQAESSLFEDPASLTLISPATEKILASIEKKPNGKFIFVSEKARAQSKLVKAFSQDALSLAIAAYASPLLHREFESYVEDLTLAPSFKASLFKAYQNDYGGFLAALKTIHLYGDVPESHYKEFSQLLSYSDDLSPFLYAVLAKDKRNVIKSFSLLTLADAISWTRRLSRTFQSLLELSRFQKSSQPISWHSLSTPIFFKEQPLYEEALSKWKPKEVIGFLEMLLKIEQKAKKGTLSEPYFRHELLRFLTF